MAEAVGVDVAIRKGLLVVNGPVADIPQLKRQAVQVGLTWPDGSLFGRTEIKSARMIGRERAFEREAEQTSGDLSQQRCR